MEENKKFKFNMYFENEEIIDNWNKQFDKDVKKEFKKWGKVKKLSNE